MTLSGGQKQRLFIALALINDPELVFLDELTTGLDPQARRAIWDLVRGIRDRGKTVFLTTHLMEEAERLCDRVAILDHGRVIDIGTPAELVRRHCPERTIVVATEDCERAGTLSRDPGGRVGQRPGAAVHDSRTGRRAGDPGDPMPGGASDASDRLPNRGADARGRLSQADRPRHSQLRLHNMLRGLLGLTWLEIKIFVREPMGVIGTVGIPVLLFVVLGRMLGPRARSGSPDVPRFVSVDLPIFASLLIAASAVLSLVAIMAIYREGGILKRLRATPLRPHTILTAHVIVKLLFTAVTLAAMVLVGRRYYPVGADVPLVSFTLALLFSAVSILSLGFLIASIVPTARFAQPIGTAIIYPMLGLSGLFVPVASLPPLLQAIAHALPSTYAVSLLRGIWLGEGWSNHIGDVVMLAVLFLVFTAVSARVFRWE